MASVYQRSGMPLYGYSSNMEQGGATVVIRPEFMRVGRRYLVNLWGEECIAIKRRGGAIDFYIERERRTHRDSGRGGSDG